MEAIISILESVESKLIGLEKDPITKTVTTGVDGFVDSICKAVRKRDYSETSYYNTIHEFADRLTLASGKSCQVELEVQLVKMGGNGPILSNALAKLGIDSFCIGSMGFPEFHPLFNTLNRRCTPISLLSPGKSDAIEFNDGKLIFSDLSTFSQYDWAYIKRTAGLEKLRATILESDLIALVDWANVTHAEDIWEGILEDIIKPSGRRDFLFFFDLCDPSKKSAQHIDDILDIISSFSFYGKVTLGMNENETMTIWSSLTGVDQKDPVNVGGRFIHYAVDVDCLLIHPIDRTIAFHKNEFLELPGRLVTNPKIQTGGGDNLNAGFIVGLLAGLGIDECMVLGMAASGYYVQEGQSGTLSQLREYIAQWRKELEVTSYQQMSHDKEH